MTQIYVLFRRFSMIAAVCLCARAGSSMCVCVCVCVCVHVCVLLCWRASPCVGTTHVCVVAVLAHLLWLLPKCTLVVCICAAVLACVLLHLAAVTSCCVFCARADASSWVWGALASMLF